MENKKTGLYLCRPYTNSKGKIGRAYNLDGIKYASAHERDNDWRVMFVNGDRKDGFKNLAECDKYVRTKAGYPLMSKAAEKGERKSKKSAAKMDAESKALGAIPDTELKSACTLAETPESKKVNAKARAAAKAEKAEPKATTPAKGKRPTKAEKAAAVAAIVDILNTNTATVAELLKALV